MRVLSWSEWFNSWLLSIQVLGLTSVLLQLYQNTTILIIDMAGQPQYNWDTIRRAYIASDEPLVRLAREHTGIKSDPSYKTLRNRSSQENWEERRREFQDSLRTEVACAPKVQEVLDSTQKTLETAMAIAHQANLLEDMKGSARAFFKKLKQLSIIENMELQGLSPLELSQVLVRFSQIAASTYDLERKMVARQQPSPSVNVTVANAIDFSGMSVEELKRIVGE